MGVSPAIPADEGARLDALHDLAIVDTPTEERFDRIVRLATRLFGMPASCITFVDAEREWHKSRVGVEGPESPRAESLCAHAILGDGPMLVEDLASDPRFDDNPALRQGFRFFAAEIVRSPGGEAVGALCVLDRAPRTMSQEELRDLRALADGVEAELRTVELRRALAAQRESEEVVQTILRASVVAVIGFDRDGWITFANPAASQLLGWTVEELLGKDGHDLFHHSHADGSPYPRSECPTLRVFLDGVVVRLEDVFWRRDGTSFPCECLTAPLEHDGKIFGAVSTFHDIRDRREVDKLKDEFASVIGHELRTPLTSIRASIGLLGESAKLDPAAGRLLATAALNTERLERIVNDIVDLERLESGVVTLDLQPHEVGPLAEEAAGLVHAMARRAGVEVRVNAAPVRVRADRERVVQALTNLLANAIGLSPSGEPVVVFARPDGDDVVVSVVDRGPGIPHRLHGTIFERFSQADASDAREVRGTGLGLAIVRGIAESHGGRVWVDSTPGEGATLAFTLPAA